MRELQFVAVGAFHRRGHVGVPVGPPESHFAVGPATFWNRCHIYPSLTFQDQGNGPIVHEPHFHFSPEHTGFHGHPLLREELHEPLK